MARYNARVRVRAALDETGGAAVVCRFRVARHDSFLAALPLFEFLNNPTIPGQYSFEVDAYRDGAWVVCVCITDPDAAFEVKMRWG